MKRTFIAGKTDADQGADGCLFRLCVSGCSIGRVRSSDSGCRNHNRVDEGGRRDRR